MGILSGVANAVSGAAQTAFENVKDNLSDTFGSILGNSDRVRITLGGYTTSDLLSADAAEAIEFELPFNPSSIRIDAVAGGKQPIVTSDGRTMLDSVDPRIQVSFTAYVDEVNNADAFLFERIDRGCWNR